MLACMEMGQGTLLSPITPCFLAVPGHTQKRGKQQPIETASLPLFASHYFWSGNVSAPSSTNLLKIR